ncbi:MAG TPA: GMC family oxidoreductase [Acidothermaceae bacterium]
MTEDEFSADVVVIGSGMGGGAIARALASSGASVLVVERGDYLPREPQNWSPEEVFLHGRYKNAERWYDVLGNAWFMPGVHYFVGGNTKVYGACLPRLRERDFEAIEHADGVSPAWPISYGDLEPYYAQAERMLKVHGDDSGDPTAPPRSGPYPYPPMEHDAAVAELAASFEHEGLHPFQLPLGVDFSDAGKCIRCRTCDGFPCRVGAKSDAETAMIAPALESPSVRLLTGTRVEKLETDAGGEQVIAAVAHRGGRTVRITGSRFVLAAGAVNTTALLLSSASDTHPRGLANSSDQLGRNYMVHNSTFLVGIDPRRRNRSTFQKTLGLNDWYFEGGDRSWPLGNVQMLGKLQGPMVKPARRFVPMPLLEMATAHSIDLYLTTEDLPRADNRVRVGAGGRIEVTWRPNNLRPHAQLLRRMRRLLRNAGYPLVFSQRMGIETNSHMCGTAVMGADPATSVVDPVGRAHDLRNLWVADSSGFPSSAALNPALTIAANALRIADKGGLTC